MKPMVSETTYGLNVIMMQCLGVGGEYFEKKVSKTSLINSIRSQQGSCSYSRKNALFGMKRFGLGPNSFIPGSVTLGKSWNLSLSP